MVMPVQSYHAVVGNYHSNIFAKIAKMLETTPTKISKSAKIADFDKK